MRIFISYSRQDYRIASKLNADCKKLGFDVWFDVEDISYGGDWREQIHSGIEQSDVFVLLVSTWSLNSKIVADEYNHATDRDAQIIVVLLETPDSRYTLFFPSGRHWVDCRKHPDQVASRIQQVLVGILDPFDDALLDNSVTPSAKIIDGLPNVIRSFVTMSYLIIWTGIILTIVYLLFVVLFVIYDSPINTRCKFEYGIFST